MQAYLPEAGFEYAVTHRFRTARLERIKALERESDEARFSTQLAPGCTDLCVMALRSYEPDDIISHCTAALKDLTPEEDQALRDEAAAAREADSRDGHIRPSRDFSIIRSSRRKCSQLLLGPARFINHDCRPNAEFRRSGHTLTIRCIRPIKQNEEITTYYGDNYFEWGNKECMCAMCERLSQGFFAQPNGKGTEGGDSKEPQQASGQGMPQTSTRRLRSFSAREAAEASITEPADLIAFQVDPDALGPDCECLTCHATFRAPEKWWTPDECLRCERHYKLFKCDWPNREPNENPVEQATRVRSLKRKSKPHEKLSRPTRKTYPQASEADVSSPVKLSPVREKPPPPESLPSSTSSDSEQVPRTRTTQRSVSHSDDERVRNVPRILGQAASTDVLASYWGAPEGERKRRRRPTNMSITSLMELGKRSHDERLCRMALSPSLPARPKRKSDTDAKPASQTTRSMKRIHEDSSSTLSSSEPLNSEANHNCSSDSEIKLLPKIATHGRERTSVSNLALFWSGGVEGRTRGQARQAQMAQVYVSHPRTEAQTSPPLAPPTNSPASGSAPLQPQSHPQRHVRAKTHTPEIKQETSPFSPREPVIKSENELRTSTPPLPYRHMSPAAPVVIPPNSHPTVVPPGVPVRQPLRRNLRWGSGKISTSREPLQVAPVRVSWPAATLKTEQTSPVTSHHPATP